jgi:uncharacterized membrane protein
MKVIKGPLIILGIVLTGITAFIVATAPADYAEQAAKRDLCLAMYAGTAMRWQCKGPKWSWDR